jgi:sugar/nucleoside kinase (ribokinase family)
MKEDKPLEVVVMGAAGIDTSIFLYGADIDFSVEANFSENIDYVGGAGAYSARGFAQLGRRTGYIGYIGDDHNGRFIAEEFARDKIESLFFTDPKGSRHSVNFMYRDGRRKNFYDGKGSMLVQPDLEKCRTLLAQTKLVHLSIENWVRYVLPLARELDLTISCDLQDIVSPDDEYRRDFVEYADILFFSAANFPDPSVLIHRFLETKPERIVIVGMGSRGCALGTKEGILFFEPVQLEDPVIDSNGAGDGLAVGFLSSYCLDGYSLEESILRGQITARYTCTQRASSSHLISQAQLNYYFSQLKPIPPTGQ